MPIWASEKDIGTAIETVVEINSTDPKWEFKANTILKTKYNLYNHTLFPGQFLLQDGRQKGRSVCQVEMPSSPMSCNINIRFYKNSI